MNELDTLIRNNLYRFGISGLAAKIPLQKISREFCTSGFSPPMTFIHRQLPTGNYVFLTGTTTGTATDTGTGVLVSASAGMGSKNMISELNRTILMEAISKTFKLVN